MEQLRCIGQKPVNESSHFQQAGLSWRLIRGLRMTDLGAYDDVDTSVQKAYLICTVNADNKEFLNELTKLLKKFLSREILTSHTAQRLSSTKKPIFKSTNFYICLKDSLMHVYSGKKVIEDEVLCKIIGAIINNAYDGKIIGIKGKD
ncbi:uncharacterized protein LOC116416337 [Nasonia vitripennis]|uniref:Uncharacterized protein n=1 Tax=Nasonia vitripennis TaxID=7425 RepID=A0A7M7T7I4_NASVI|nr:uncharacterized protein LOC116416337 [Nasonia vitripennis]